MPFHLTSDSLDDIHRKLLLRLLHESDFESAPRGKPIRELVASGFTLTDPRARLIESSARNLNYGFAVGELCWYVRGDSDLETMVYYNKRMSQFSDDGKTINSAYGNRIFKERWHGEGQFQNVLSELKKDPDSRRAVIHINEPWDLRKAQHEGGSKDVPCTMSLQFLIRDRRLHMHVLMRSNDIVWGMPYDVFSFTCLQELTLYSLQHVGVPVDDLGSYHHTAGSLHIYDTHYAMASEITTEEPTPPAPMLPFTMDELDNLSNVVEPVIRLGRSSTVQTGGPTTTWMTMKLLKHRLKRDAETANKESE